VFFLLGDVYIALLLELFEPVLSEEIFNETINTILTLDHPYLVGLGGGRDLARLGTLYRKSCYSEVFDSKSGLLYADFAKTVTAQGKKICSSWLAMLMWMVQCDVIADSSWHQTTNEGGLKCNFM